MPYRVLTLAEVASRLHVSEADVEQLVRGNEIPHERQGSRLIFRQRDIEAWASQRILGLSYERLADYHRAASVKRHSYEKKHTIVTELTQPAFIHPALAARTRPSALRQMVALAESTGLLLCPQELLTSLEEREKLCSTALPGGFALLHPRHHEPYMFQDSFIALGRTPHPLPFGAMDGSMTDLFFLICCQDDRLHLHALARLAMICSHTPLLNSLRQAADAGELHQAIAAAETQVIEKTL